MTCPTCGIELGGAPRHETLADCVRFLAEYIQGSERTTDEALDKMEENLRHEANDIRSELASEIESVRAEIGGGS